MKRFLVAVALFTSGIVLVVASLFLTVIYLSEERATGFGIVLSPAAVALAVAFLLLLALGSVWFSGKLIR
jgi:hypothetical protein